MFGLESTFGGIAWICEYDLGFGMGLYDYEL